MTIAVQPAWYPDPLAHHEYRYWDGTAWTQHVSDAGATSQDQTLPDPEDITFRVQSAKSLGRTRDPRAIAPLLACLHDEDSLVRTNAMLSLLGIASAREPLITLLTNPDSDESTPAISALWEAIRFGNVKGEPLVRLVVVGALQLAYFSGQPARTSTPDFMFMLRELGDDRGQRLLSCVDSGDLRALEQMIAQL